MTNISFAVCDDDKITCDAIFRCISTIFSKCGINASGSKFYSPSALYYHAVNRSGGGFDIVFLDIDMPQYSGIDLGKALRHNGAESDIIFVSNREDKVFETFSVNPSGFVRKKNFSSDLRIALKSYLSKKLSEESYLVVQTNNNSTTLKLPVSKIVYVEGMRDHQYIVMEDGERVDVRMTLGELEEKLVQFDIVRTHKSFLVNLKYVRRIDVSEIVLSNDQMVLLSRSKSREIKDIYLKYLRKVGSVMFTE